MKTRITELLGIEYPIIQGGMAWVAESHLAAAVSAAGGLGLIGGANAPAEVIRNYIREVKAVTDKPFGVNVMLMSPYADEVAKANNIPLLAQLPIDPELAQACDEGRLEDFQKDYLADTCKMITALIK